MRIIRCSVLLLLASLTIIFNLAFTSPFTTTGHDWQSFITSARAASDGLNPYAVYPGTLRIVQQDGSIATAPNLNPPILLPVFGLFAGMDISLSYRIWQILSLAAYIGAIAVLIHELSCLWFERILWLATFAPLWSTLAPVRDPAIRHEDLPELLAGVRLARPPALEAWIDQQILTHRSSLPFIR